MVAAARLYNPNVQFTIYPDATHNSWERTYNNDSIYQWLLAQKKFSYTEVPGAPGTLKKYPGKYVSPDKDTVTVTLEHETLTAKTNNHFFPLKAAGGHLFFIDAHLPVDLRFMFDAKGKVDSFLLMEDRKVIYRKI